MDEQTVQSNNGNDKKDYFEHGNVRIIIKEHFREDGKSFENIIEDSMLRQARAENRCVVLPPSGTG